MEVATRNGEELVERRSFLGVLAGASLGVLSEGGHSEGDSSRCLNSRRC
jgi:hypothetical protein